MCGHIQATLCCICGPGDPELYQNPKTNRDKINSNTKADAGTMQTPHQVAMRNGKLSDGSKWKTLGVPPPHCQPNSKSHMAALIWKWDWMPCPGNARVQHQHEHHCLHQEKPGTTELSKGRDLRPNHLPHQTPQNRGSKPNKVGHGGKQSTLPGWRRNTNCRPTNSQASH